MKIRERAEIISQNKNFTEKANIYYRLNRLIDEKQMGTLFKVMLVNNKKDKFPVTNLHILFLCVYCGSKLTW